MEASLRRSDQPVAIVLMGVAGSGKTTLGLALAARLGLTFYDADDFHPPANVAKMSAGIPLTDEDRAPWLARLADLLRDSLGEGRSVALACSALKRRYRDRLREGCPAILFVHQVGDRAMIAERMKHRPGHYMPPSLLDSQFAALELPDADENVLTLDGTEPPALLVDQVVARIAGS
ncbi:gluconokinase [Chelatococcus asaccharovorans]|uniref:gluconokinase n=1 Tax=Chelatococcus asaccharovorans TaxID=28210 RepID=UPI0022642EEC|nr:gluconokinase [Chelatococcus asaccharovorans]